MKKIELHLHFDGSIDVGYASWLMKRNVKDELVSKNDSSLNEYLKKFDLPIKLLQEPYDVEMFAYFLAKELEKDEVIYAEIRFCPLFHVEKVKLKEIVDAMLDGFAQVPAVKINLIFCMMRQFSEEKNMEIIELTKKYLGHGVVAIDLAGDELKYKTRSFEKLFTLINKYKIPFTIHAGEVDDYTSVSSALDFGAKRIGHGISSIQSQEVIDRLVKERVVLEICPTSNLNTKAVDRMDRHPIKELMAKGVLCTINTDNRTVSNTTLDKEYFLLQNMLGFTDEDFRMCNLSAIEAAFISDEEKDELRKKLDLDE